MKIAIGSDHAGLEFKALVTRLLTEMGHEVTDCGTLTKDSCDYPDFGIKVAQAVVAGEVDYGVNICWTGNGMMMVGNKVKGARAGIALNAEMAYYTRLHNDANILTLAQKYTPEDQLPEILKTFLETKFEGGRHQRRVDKMMAIQNN